MTATDRLGFYGFGEAAQVLACGLSSRRTDLTPPAYDIRQVDLSDRATDAGCEPAGTPAELAGRAELLLALVPADAVVAAASAIAPWMRRSHTYVDGASVSPRTKQRVGEVIESAGGRMVDAAIMGSVPEAGLEVPILLSGDTAVDTAKLLAGLGFKATAIGDRIGQASAIKMIRSVFMKGLEALFIEMLLGARRYEVEEAVVESVERSIEGKALRKIMDTLVVSQARHSARKAAEMSHVMATLSEAGVPDVMSRASRGVFLWLVDLDLLRDQPSQDLGYERVIDLLDRAVGTYQQIRKERIWSQSESP
jgi:3-hydroxyisobutyrate dehydrogenase-like beta-hydroxyacid dehydrogenase